MTFTADLQKTRTRLVPCVQGIAFGVLLVMVGAMVDPLPASGYLGPIFHVVGAALITACGIGTIILSRGLPVTRNLLSVDPHGLVLVRRGRAQRWRWVELSAARRQRRSATLTAESGGRQRTVRIDDIYPTPLDEVISRINDFRDRALAGRVDASDADAPQTVPALPVRYHVAQAALNRQRWRDLGLILSSAALFPTLVLLWGDELDFGNYPVGLIHWMAAIVAFVILVSASTALLASARLGNFLQLTDEGLAQVRRGFLVRQWRWQDLSSFEIRAGRVAGASRGAETIAFVAADDGKLLKGIGLQPLIWAQTKLPGAVSQTVEDTHEAPLDRIVADLNARRERALADIPPARLVELQAADQAMAGHHRLGFHKNLQDLRSLGIVGWTLTLACFVWVPIVVVLGWPFDGLVNMDGPAQSMTQWLERFLVMLVPIGIIAEVLFLMREITPADNALVLDSNGLTLMRGGRKKLWEWRDLSAFVVEPRRVLGMIGPSGVIVFSAPGGRDLRSRFLRLCYRLTGRGPAMVIEDIYDTPLDDIAATLNQYRAQNASDLAPPLAT